VSEPLDVHTLWILLVGLTVIASGLIQGGLRRLGVPALVGYLLLGVLLALADARWGLLTEPVRTGFGFLADLGVVALLFRVGLDSHPGALARKLPRAAGVWVGDVAGSALLGFAAAHLVLGLGLIPSLIAATALTATSVGVSVAAWREADALGSGTGQLLIDVAELDDISAVVLMALLFTLIPLLQGEQGAWWPTLGLTAAGFLAKLALFVAFCYLFSRHAEGPITRLAGRLEPPPQRMLTVAGVGFVIAAMASSLGFSLAIGALFAGLVFSRDPEAVKTEKSFQDVYAFVTPFFFINFGLQVSPEHLGAGAGLGAVLLVAAVAGKALGAGTPAFLAGGVPAAALIGTSMIPRAEIAMIVMHQGLRLGHWAVPQRLYAAVLFVSAASCLLAPLALSHLLRRWPPAPEEAP
jgi:Kef-type K+ transport system membrane component KefB